jgi:simple sugar transport system permease protein
MDLILLSSVIALSAPLVIAAIGETITEKAGVINLSIEGTLLLSAMTGFAVAHVTQNAWLGVIAASGIGVIIAAFLCVGSITLRQDQLAVGFVLTILTGKLSSFLGVPFINIPGPWFRPVPVPFLSTLPVVGELFFDHSILTYFSFAAIIGSWIWFTFTQSGLKLIGLGQNPRAAFVRGVNVNRMRYVYTMIGGALIGIAGAAYSLNAKLGWSHGHTSGFGWIALALVIFGGWHPLKVAVGAYLFGLLRSLAGEMQSVFPNIPVQVFPLIPFALMILSLIVTNSKGLERLLTIFPRRYRDTIQKWLLARPPRALATTFDIE